MALDADGVQGYKVGAFPYDPVSLSVADTTDNAAASISGNPLTGIATVQASASANKNQDDDSSGQVSLGDNGLTAKFLLTPATKLVFLGTADVVATATTSPYQQLAFGEVMLAFFRP